MGQKKGLAEIKMTSVSFSGLVVPLPVFFAPPGRRGQRGGDGADRPRRLGHVLHRRELLVVHTGARFGAPLLVPGHFNHDA